MLRIGARRLAQGTVLTVSAGAVGYGAVMATTRPEQVQGLQRQIRFWSSIAPVVLDYYIQTASSSPYVKFQKYCYRDTTKESQPYAEIRKETLQQLHEKHSKNVYAVMLQLKGLYIKLGQVLSVTTLPIPNPYRVLFRTLQSNVPGHEEFSVVKSTLERELGIHDISEIFESMDPVPCGAASIGQAHKAVLKKKEGENVEVVIVKVQYPDACWQVPADIQCVGDLLRICVFFGVVDDTAANLSFSEFSRQFLSELNYDQERENLQEIRASSLDPKAPYQRRGVVVPEVYGDLCTSKVITMSYLPGPKLEEEARRQLEALGIDMNKGLRSIVQDATKDTADDKETDSGREIDEIVASTRHPTSQRLTIARTLGNVVGLDSILWAMRFVRKISLMSRVILVKSIETLLSFPLTKSLVSSTSLQEWAETHRTASEQANRLALTKEWVEALFDVHGHQVFQLGCFNADCHPGNILILDDSGENGGKRWKSPKLGLIDFGQCKRLTTHERFQIAKLVVSVANEESDEAVANVFREMGVRTRNDSTEFLAKFARLMFGPLQSYHMNHEWHRTMHQQDQVTYFPNQLSMVYRTSMLLRGLAISLQLNVSVSDLWKGHAQAAIDSFPNDVKFEEMDSMIPMKQDLRNKEAAPLVRTMTSGRKEPLPA